ncbi:MAG: hypothetical protein R6V47_03665 [Candidatus Delongbacteria bacterium]
MKKIYFLLILMIFLFSCYNRSKSCSYDVSELGTINSIKEIKGKMFILNGTNSSIHLLDKGKTVSFRNIDVKGRDFLLDFCISQDTVFWSNTYDKIFISLNSDIIDTIMIDDPDKIEKRGEELFITSRIPKKGFFSLRKISLSSGKIISETFLNDEKITNAVFSKTSIKADKDKIYLVNPIKNRLEIYNSELDILSFTDLEQDYSYGNLFVTNEEVRIICEKNNSLFLCISGFEKDPSFINLNTSSENIDIVSSYVSLGSVYLYDFIRSEIIFLPL